jgi:hypothetical protein
MSKIIVTVDELRRLKDAGLLVDIGGPFVWDARSLNWVTVVIAPAV